MKLIEALESMGQGILLCNEKGEIIFFNQAYRNFTGLDPKKSLGKPITKVRPSAKVPKVLKTGKPITNIYRTENGQEYFANIYPVFREDELIGTSSIITELLDYRDRTESAAPTLKERVRAFERNEILSMMQVYGDSVDAKRQIAKILGISLASLYEKLGKTDSQSKS